MLTQPRRFLFVLLFLALGLTLEVLFWQSQAHAALAIALSPVLCAAQWIETQLDFLNLSPLASELGVVFPVTLIYFGLVGYWFKRILEEPGFFKWIMLTLVIVFLLFLHWQSALALREAFPFLKGLNLPEFRLSF